MNVNTTKLVIAGVLAAACIVALALDSDNADWAGPILTLLVGYVIGNAQVTSREGVESPIVSLPSKLSPPPPPPEFP